MITSDKSSGIKMVGKDDNTACCFGPESKVLFNLNSYLIRDMDPRILGITDTDGSQFSGRTIFFMLDSLIPREQLASVNSLFTQAMEYLKREIKALYFASLEFSIVTSMNHHRRILFHFSNGKPASESWVLGKFIDITHFLPEGPPRLFIYDQNGKIELSVSNSIEVLQDSGFHLNPKEIDVILLKSKGMRAKEIALKLEISTLSVYSIIRDVKQKTGMELLPLVVYLEKMGVIN